MLLRHFLQTARLWNNTQNKNAIILALNYQQKRSIGLRNPPPIPELIETEEGDKEIFNPKTEGSLEEFLNIRFGPDMPTILDDQNERRDVKNFPRPVIQDFPEPCRLGIIPESWFQMFYEKTGVTGPYCFFWGLLTFLLSKEWLVIEHEILAGVEATVIIAICAKIFGPNIRKALCEKTDECLKNWDDWQKGMINFLSDYIKIEESIRDSPKHHKILFDAKRENVQLQLETEFRRRQMEAYNEVRRRLDYLVAKEEAERQFKQKHMVNWIIDNVAKSITSTQEKETLKNTLLELKRLSSTIKI